MHPTLGTIAEYLPTAIAGLAGAGIIYVGGRFLRDPQGAARAFGVAVPHQAGPYFAIKGVRDITSGLVPLAVLATGSRRTLGWTLLAAAFTPFADMLIVLRNGGSARAAFGIHGLTAAVLSADATALLLQTRRR